MSTRPHNHSDDTSRRSRGVGPVLVRHSSRETMAAPPIVTPEPSSSARSAPYPPSHVRTERGLRRSPSKSQIFHDAQERMDVERDITDHRKRSTTSTKDEGSMYAREGEGSKMRDEFRPHTEEDQHQHKRDRPDDRRDTSRGMHYSAAASKEYLAQSRELSVLQNELQLALEERQALANNNMALRQQHEERSRKFSAMRNEHAALKRQCEQQEEELDAVHHEREAALVQKQKVEEDYAALRQKYESLSDGYNTLRGKNHSLKATLEQRTSELQGAQRFLTTADRFSGSEVVNMLRKLNEEVQQITTFMAEWAVGTFTFKTLSHTTPLTAEQTKTSEVLGMRLTQLLGTKKHRENPILVEMALRAYLIYELHGLTSSWSIGQEEQSHNVHINGIYQRMWEAEGQAISGNWRALTRAYILPACTISDPELARTVDTIIISCFSDILLAAGCTASQLDIVSALRSKFTEKVHHFVSLAGQVNKIIGVGVISEDFEVVVVFPDTVFDNKAMEDSYEDSGRMKGTEEHKETVLCATELGLIQRMGVGTGEGQNRKPSERIVIKPKVALVSVIDVISE